MPGDALDDVAAIIDGAYCREAARLLRRQHAAGRAVEVSRETLHTRLYVLDRVGFSLDLDPNLVAPVTRERALTFADDAFARVRRSR